MTISTNRESDRFIVRLPDGMRDRIKAFASENNRSMNAEIVARLEASFSPTPKPEWPHELVEQFIALLKDYKAP